MNHLLMVCSEYCTGCGLCHSLAGVTFQKDSNEFYYPMLSLENYDLCKIVCPAAGYAMKTYSNGSILGEVRKVNIGWSANAEIRHQASSGGVITSLCLYLIRNKLVDGVIGTRCNSLDVRLTETVVCKTEIDILSCMGSRYTVSSPLLNIKNLIEEGKKYVFVGKPCDVSALRMLKDIRLELWVEQVVYMFSFFCAGQPSLAANNKLLKALGCEKWEYCDHLQYRGNGWPGFAMAKLKNGGVNQIDYETTWMKILGRDVRRSCRFCADGTGEYADISCGDAWYLTSSMQPDLTEHLGRNVVFARTEKGVSLLSEIVSAGDIIVEGYDIEKDKLRNSQPYHYTRKASLNSLRIAMLLCGRKFPLYDREKLAMFANNISIKEKMIRVLGTLQRIWKKKI